MSEMVDKVAKALWENDQANEYLWGFSNPILYGDEWNGKPVPWDWLLNNPNLVPSCVGDVRKKARAAIKAMAGDPGHDITAAVVEPTDDRRWAVKAWSAMIDEALK